MKLKKTEIPYRHSFELTPTKNLDEMVDEDYYTIQKLVQEGKDAELKDFVNSRLLDAELAQTNKLPNTAGMLTKSYVHDIVGQHLVNENPEVAQYLEANDHMKAIEKLLSSLHPNYKKHMQAAYEKGPIKYKILKYLHGGDVSNIEPVRSLPESIQGYFLKDTGISMNPSQSPRSFASTLKHELDHATDYAAETLSEDKEFLKDYPKYKGFKEKSHEGAAESGYINPIIPNFNDYDFKKGEFGSNYVRDPYELAEEVTGKHRYGREHLFEELRKKLK